MAPPKAKGQKMALGEFLTDTSLGSWADEMENAPMPCGRNSTYTGDRSFGSGGGYGSGGFSDRGYSVREQLPLPSKPPYTVHLGNMSFDATEGDIQDFFSDCSITSVRIVEDKMDRKPKGFGYAEFATLDGLKKALEFNGTQFQGRNIRVSVAEPQKDRPDARDFGDWSRKGPLPEVAGQRRVSDRHFGNDRHSERVGYGSGRSFNDHPDVSVDRPNRRPGFEQNDGKVRDLGNWERKGPLTPTLPASASTARSYDRPVSRDGPRERKNSPAWGEGRSQDGSRPPRREFVERPPVDRTPTAAEQDNQWRAKMRPDPPAASPAISPAPSSKELSVPSSPASGPAPIAAPAPLTSRPKLHLQKRTVSEAEPSPALATGTSDPKASPFGAAKPINTFAREKEIEEKRDLAARQKKEREDKVREEKRLAEEKAKDERRLAKEADQGEKPSSSKDKPNGQHKDNERGGEPPTRNYQILRRATDDDNALENKHATNEATNGTPTENKSVGSVDTIPDGKRVNGFEHPQDEVSASPIVEHAEEEGWSTVSKLRKNQKGNNQAARAAIS